MADRTARRPAGSAEVAGVVVSGASVTLGQLTCPECGSTEFEVLAGEVACDGCGLIFTPPKPSGTAK